MELGDNYPQLPPITHKNGLFLFPISFGMTHASPVGRRFLPNAMTRARSPAVLPSSPPPLRTTRQTPSPQHLRRLDHHESSAPLVNTAITEAMLALIAAGAARAPIAGAVAPLSPRQLRQPDRATLHVPSVTRRIQGASPCPFGLLSRLSLPIGRARGPRGPYSPQGRKSGRLHYRHRPPCIGAAPCSLPTTHNDDARRGAPRCGFVQHRNRIWNVR